MTKFGGKKDVENITRIEILRLRFEIITDLVVKVF